jgi:hypothetical protein
VERGGEVERWRGGEVLARDVECIGVQRHGVYEIR